MSGVFKVRLGAGSVRFAIGLHVHLRWNIGDTIMGHRRIRAISVRFHYRGSGSGGLLSAAPDAARERRHRITGH